MTKMKKIAMLFIGMMTFATGMNAQDNVEASVSADIVSNYVWRGKKCDNSAIQPSAGIAYKGFSVSAWGSYGLQDNPLSELDLTVAYAAGGFNVGITDYWSTQTDDRYFLYDAHKTAHVFEANVGYDFGPLSLQWYTNFAGADGLNKDGKRAYSSYVEANAPFVLGGLDWTATIGAVPYATDYYPDANGFAVTSIALKASKDIKITDSFSVPVFAQIATNPSTQKAYLVFGLTLRP